MDHLDRERNKRQPASVAALLSDLLHYYLLLLALSIERVEIKFYHPQQVNGPETLTEHPLGQNSYYGNALGD